MKRSRNGNSVNDSLEVLSLKDLNVNISDDVREYLSNQYHHDVEDCQQHLNQILQAMKVSPATAVCRLNQIKVLSRQEIQNELQEELDRTTTTTTTTSTGNSNNNGVFVTVTDPQLHDVLHVLPKDDAWTSSSSSLFDSCGPVSSSSTTDRVLFSSWPSREKNHWPMTHRVVICDRFCGEAVLRGSHIFVRGIMCADSGIQEGEKVAVYADIRAQNEKGLQRGLLVEHYTGRCVFLGMGQACCKRADFFNADKGLGVKMSCHYEERAGPLLPPIQGLLATKIFFQNLPSILVGHALDPQPGDVILDMCSAPGGKTLHVASLLRNNGMIVACDKSRKKVLSAKALYDEMGATCVVPLALDSTNCVHDHGNTDTTKNSKTVKEVISAAAPSPKDGLLTIKKFYPESFDRIILDPPCSALGLRPKLYIPHSSVPELRKHATYQRKFIKQAVELLKPNGTMTYSTCTFHMEENEGMVKYILDHFPSLELQRIDYDGKGRPGLQGAGLDQVQRNKVRRFDPSETCDTIGFFVAKFKKQGGP